MDDTRVLTVEVDGPVATVWLDRAEARNALGPAFWEALPEVFGDLAGDDSVRAVVLAARGPCFSVGLDLKTMPLGGSSPLVTRAPDAPSSRPSHAARSAQLRKEILRLQAAVTSIAACPKPVIAAVHGYCIGGGVDLATACDIRLAAADALFSVRETRVAIVADLGSLQRLPRIVGAGHAAALAYTGQDVPAARAKEIGLVNDVLPDRTSLLAAAAELAQAITANSPLAVQGAKWMLTAGAEREVAAGLDEVATWNAAFLPSDDLTEALTAFAERRPPRFRGS